MLNLFHFREQPSDLTLQNERTITNIQFCYHVPTVTNRWSKQVYMEDKTEETQGDIRQH